MYILEIFKYLFISVVFLIAINMSQTIYGVKQNSKFNIWVENFKNQLHDKHNIPKRFLDQVFKDIKYKEEIHKHNIKVSKRFKRKPSEKRLEVHINQLSYEPGIALYNKKSEKFDEIEKKYQIPAALVISFLSRETNFGKFISKYKPLDSLVNLAYKNTSKSKARYFQLSLEYYILLLYTNKISIKVLSSFDGGLGMPQFMPYNYYTYGVDYNQDNNIDLSYTIDDIAASVSNFLNALHWNYQYKDIIEKVKVRNNSNAYKQIFDLATHRKSSSIKYKYTLKEWQELGVIISKKSIKNLSVNPSNTKYALVKLNSNLFLLNPNFKSILGYNHSVLYGISICMLYDKYSAYINAYRKKNKNNNKVTVNHAKVTHAMKEHLSSIKKERLAKKSTSKKNKSKKDLAKAKQIAKAKELAAKAKALAKARLKAKAKALAKAKAKAKQLALNKSKAKELRIAKANAAKLQSELAKAKAKAKNLEESLNNYNINDDYLDILSEFLLKHYNKELFSNKSEPQKEDIHNLPDTTLNICPLYPVNN